MNAAEMTGIKLREMKQSKAIGQEQFHSEQHLNWGSDGHDGHAERFRVRGLSF